MIYPIIRVRFKRPRKLRTPRPDPAEILRASIWEAARIAEKYDNYCVPTPAGYELRYAGRIRRIVGKTAQDADAMAALLGVDTADWILYTFARDEQREA